MTKQVKYFILIPLIIMSLNFVLTKVLDRIYEINVYGQTGGNLNYYFQQDVPDILIVGASNIQYNINPDSVSSSCFNLGHNAMRDGFHASVIKLLEDQNHLPNKTLIYCVDIDNYVTGIKVGRDIESLKYYYYENNNIRKNINENTEYNFLKYLFTLYKYNGWVSSMALNTIKTLRHERTDKGFFALPHTYTDSTNVMIKSKYIEEQAKNIPFLDMKSFEVSGGNYYLDIIISICKRNNLPIVLFTAPLYKNNYSEETLDQFSKYLASKQLPFIDFHSLDNPLLANPNLWKENFHLNEDGAKVFSSLFRKELLKRNIIQN